MAHVDALHRSVLIHNHSLPHHHHRALDSRRRSEGKPISSWACRNQTWI